MTGPEDTADDTADAEHRALVEAELRYLRAKNEAKQRHAQETEAEAAGTDAPLKDQLLSLSDLAKLPPIRPLVDGFLYRDTLAQLSGPPGSYKTFLALSMACSVALGRAWEGHPVPEAGPVVYVVAEGATGVRARVLAWCELTNVDPADLGGHLHFLPRPIQLGNIMDITQAVDMVHDTGAILLVLDTRARCTLGLEENSATEQGKAVHHSEEIQRAGACTVLAVHHSGRAGGAGRGSNSWDGAVWSDLRVTGEDLEAKIHCEKHKDVPAGCDHHFRMVPHVVSENLMPGCTVVQRSTLVSIPTDPLETFSDARPSGRAVLEIVRKTDTSEGLTRAAIVRLCKEQGLGQSSTYTAIKTLVTGGSLHNIGTDDKPRYVATEINPREAK
jgi:AAA domain